MFNIEEKKQLFLKIKNVIGGFLLGVMRALATKGSHKTRFMVDLVEFEEVG